MTGQFAGVPTSLAGYYPPAGPVTRKRSSWKPLTIQTTSAGSAMPDRSLVSLMIAVFLCQFLLVLPAGSAAAPQVQPLVLKAEAFRHYVEEFNKNDKELYQGNFPNAAAWDFLKDNIPLLDCPDEDIQTTYYFRWWTYRKHIKKTPAGFIVDEFLPNVGWAGKYNTINCAAGHHIYEGRWLRDPQYLDDYSRFWFRGGGEPRRYSFWAADAIWARYCVTRRQVAGHRSAARTSSPITRRGKSRIATPTGCTGRSTTATAWRSPSAAAAIAPRSTATNSATRRRLRGSRNWRARRTSPATIARKRRRSRRLVQEKLWDADAQFFKVLPRVTPLASAVQQRRGAGVRAKLASVRELHGFTPWYFNLPDPQFAVAWKQVMDPQGFFAPFGLTTAEQRCPQFAVAYAGHECQWNGPSWPFATAVTLTGLANLLNGPPQDAIGAKDYFELLKIYAKSQRLTLDDGRVVPWIDENQNPANGDWISRTLLIQRKQEPAGTRQGLQPLDILRSGDQRADRSAPAGGRHGRGESARAADVGLFLPRPGSLPRPRAHDPLRQDRLALWQRQGPARFGRRERNRGGGDTRARDREAGAELQGRSFLPERTNVRWAHGSPAFCNGADIIVLPGSEGTKR